MRHSHIRSSNLQWLCEDFPVTCRIAAAEVAGIDQESHPIAEKLQILQLTRTVTVDAAAPVATPGAEAVRPLGLAVTTRPASVWDIPSSLTCQFLHFARTRRLIWPKTCLRPFLVLSLHVVGVRFCNLLFTHKDTKK